MTSNTLWDTLKERGFIFDASSPEILQTRLETPLTLYMGFDVTAASFHVGHLVPLMLLKHLHTAGHRVIVLIGTGTSRVGDPSDKKAERPLLDLDTIKNNAYGLKKCLQKFLNHPDLLVVDNADWLCDLNHLDFLRDVGRHFSVNRMMSFDFIKNRLAQNLPLSFLEMSYMLLQSYDFLTLFDRYDCCLQIGGQDQWANMISGTDLIRKSRQKEAFVLTCPLLTTSDGKKMGKSENGAIWLDPELLSPYEFWQFWRNTADADVFRFLKLFTFLPLEEIEAARRCQGAELNVWKITLADHVTQLVHNDAGLQSARQTTKMLFEDDSSADIITFDLKKALGHPPYNILDVLVATEFASSKSEARRLVRAGAIKLDQTKISDETVSFLTGEKAPPKKLSLGKKKHVYLNVSNLVCAGEKGLENA